MSYSKRRIALATVLTVTLSVVAVPPALADAVGAQTNSARPGDLPVLAGADQLAGASAASQAAAGTLFHADLSGLLGTCDLVGEVIGTGPDVPAVFSAFRQSSSHWSIITNPAWTAMGTGLATATDGMLYVSVVFCRQAGAVTPAAVPQTAPGEPSVGAAPAVQAQQAITELSEEVPVRHKPLPALGARRAEIRAMLDRQARSMLPDWYVGVCGTGDRGRMLEGSTSDSGACPNAS